ncbi:MAG: bbp9 [Candidatus Saccharibacteria bacterium]|nr:bbp9 [Candidatus Saccharibacteria bacterium]
MKPRFIYMHGNQTTHWSFAWAKWLERELKTLGYDTFFETMPDSIIARKEYWLPFLKDQAKVTEDDVIIGWSTGAVAAMRYAENNKIAGSVLISPCYTDLDDELEKQSGYYDNPWNWEAIRSNQSSIALIYGDDDPYIKQAEFEEIAEYLEPAVLKITGGKHFIEQNEFPELLSYIRQTY